MSERSWAKEMEGASKAWLITFAGKKHEFRNARHFLPTQSTWCTEIETASLWVESMWKRRAEYWAIRCSVHSFARTAHSLATLRTGRFTRTPCCAHSFTRSLTRTLRSSWKRDFCQWISYGFSPLCARLYRSQVFIFILATFLFLLEFLGFMADGVKYFKVENLIENFVLITAILFILQLTECDGMRCNWQVYLYRFLDHSLLDYRAKNFLNSICIQFSPKKPLRN